MVDNGSPRDIGPAAKAFPDLDFLVYHSGFEFSHFGAPPEGPYTEETANDDVQKLRQNPGKSPERWDFDVQRRPWRFLGSQMIVGAFLGASRENRQAMPPKSLNIEGKWAAERLG
jgi:hypothetical protein